MISVDQDDEQQLLCLELDVCCVQIIILYKSKGLEYLLVFLFFVGVDGGVLNIVLYCMVYVGGQCQLYWKLGKDEVWEVVIVQCECEQCVEDVCLLYVGLICVEYVLWIVVGDLVGFGRMWLVLLLGDLQVLCVYVDVCIDDSEVLVVLLQLVVEVEGDFLVVCVLIWCVLYDWWVYSFIQLVYVDVGVGSDIEVVVIVLLVLVVDEFIGLELLLELVLLEFVVVVEDSVLFDLCFMGSCFGNVLYEVMENVDFVVWVDW